jgi:hypothetical protein
MRNLIPFFLITLFAAQGCATFSFGRKHTGDPTVLTAAEIKTRQNENRARLAGPDSPRHMSRTFFGVDVSGENPLLAIGHISWSLPKRLINFIQGDTPMKAAVAMEDSRSPDHRRIGMMKLITYRFARKEPYTKRYAQIASDPVDYTVRAAAIRALNYSRSRVDVGAFMAGLEDPEATIRLEAAKALANIPIDNSAPKLADHLTADVNKDVRIASADALRNFKTLEVARQLTGVLGDRDFAVAWQARQSLILMTGRDFRYDDSAWLDYLAKAKNPFLS